VPIAFAAAPKEMAMDPESLKTLLPWLVFGALLLLMMRYGCGFHMLRRRRAQEEPLDEAQDNNARDPVCGMEVERSHAAATSMHDGRTYYFCSVSCRDQFAKEPERFVYKPARARGCC
jgi:YHS domain-containing protein